MNLLSVVNILTERNIFVDCSKSGKLSKGHVKTWVTSVLKDEIQDKALLLLDS